MQYKLLDSGDGYRLERFGNNIIARPESIAIWQPQTPIAAWRYAAQAIQQERGHVSWQINKPFIEPWIMHSNSFSLQLKLSTTKNIGVFPEQASNWQWMQTLIGNAERKISVLNLFAYTGGATLAAAAAGATVCHVDAAQSVVSAAKENQRLSGLGDAPIRWIVDDCIKFVQREIKRGVRYDAIIMDPPAFGRGKDGVMFNFNTHVPMLLQLCKQLLSDKPLFFLLNAYSMGYSPFVVKNLMSDLFSDVTIEADELLLTEHKRGYILPCGVYGRIVW